MDESSCAGPNDFLLQRTRDELSVPDDHGGVVFVLVSVLALEDADGNLSRDEQTDYLFACPHGDRLHDGGHRQLPEV